MTTEQPETPAPQAPPTCTPDDNRGHYCRRNADRVWVCIICGWVRP